jgi:hypothetical protein
MNRSGQEEWVSDELIITAENMPPTSPTWSLTFKPTTRRRFRRDPDMHIYRHQNLSPSSKRQVTECTFHHKWSWDVDINSDKGWDPDKTMKGYDAFPRQSSGKAAWFHWDFEDSDEPDGTVVVCSVKEDQHSAGEIVCRATTKGEHMGECGEVRISRKFWNAASEQMRDEFVSDAMIMTYKEAMGWRWIRFLEQQARLEGGGRSSDGNVSAVMAGNAAVVACCY